MRYARIACITVAITTLMIAAHPAIADTIVQRAVVKGKISPNGHGKLSVNITATRYASGIVTGSILVTGLDPPMELIASAKVDALLFKGSTAVMTSPEFLFTDLSNWKPGSGTTLVRRRVVAHITITGRNLGLTLTDAAQPSLIWEQTRDAGGHYVETPVLAGGTVQLINKLAAE